MPSGASNGLAQPALLAQHKPAFYLIRPCLLSTRRKRLPSPDLKAPRLGKATNKRHRMNRMIYGWHVGSDPRKSLLLNLVLQVQHHAQSGLHASPKLSASTCLALGVVCSAHLSLVLQQPSKRGWILSGKERGSTAHGGGLSLLSEPLLCLLLSVLSPLLPVSFYPCAIASARRMSDTLVRSLAQAKTSSLRFTGYRPCLGLRERNIPVQVKASSSHTSLIPEWSRRDPHLHHEGATILCLFSAGGHDPCRPG